ncbi:S16 family serine protease [Paenibacillus sp. JX-17]|uniref:endopeptidase La n=1 Tax=Paenibacillus lacisoli TaxID=3064525 RepID=A0ABT9C9E2_9BACL|nr:S16 family serine protease [Paenibacillus sp. JX-17]MDO7905880.1 S16 family serine protease [Paenibacillus sp. JX-17]
MKEPVRNGGRLRSVLFAALLVAVVYVLVYMPTPYILYRPGSAEEVKPMVTVQNGDKDEKGTFMMTTVSASYPNVLMLATSYFDSNSELDKKSKRLQGNSVAEYNAQQVWYMSDSQSSAMEAAYKQAGIPYSINPDYVYVFKAEGEQTVFRPGDELLSINGKAVEDNNTIRTLLQGEQAGDTVSVELKRNGAKMTQTAKLVTIKDPKTGETRVGFGVSIATVQKVEPKDPVHEIKFADTQVGGPSAGLMFTMEIYNQLTPGDLTKGYRVAGTGTIDEDGKVGEIGGIVHKIVAADREHAEIFFAPKGNYKDAAAKAKAIGSSMKVVSVSTLNDALHYMEQLPVKS